MRKFRGKFLGPRSVTQTLCEPAQSKYVKMRLDISQEPLCRNLQVKCGDHTLCAPVRSKCISTLHKQEPLHTEISGNLEGNCFYVAK